MEKRDMIEVYVGGAFGVVAIAAAIAEYNLGEAGALAGCIKDIFSTLVVVVILFASIRFRSFRLPEKIAKAVDNWGESNEPLIFKAVDYVPAKDTHFVQGFKLLQDPKSYVKLINSESINVESEREKYTKYESRGYNFTGKFINLPSYEYMTENDFDVLVVMNQSHFKNMENIDGMIEGLSEAVNKRFSHYAQAQRSGKALEFTVRFKKIKTRDDISDFVNALDFILSVVKVIA